VRLCHHIRLTDISATYAWDVRTKRVTYESVPTIEGVVGIANYGPQAVLFTLGRNHTVQQYDINPSGTPMLVKNVQHVPANLPPSPPISDGDMAKISSTITAGISSYQAPTPLYNMESETSEDDSIPMSPLQRIAQDMEVESSEELGEARDLVPPLSPVSSRSSNISRSSRGASGKKKRAGPSYPTRYERQASGRLRPPSPSIQSTSSRSSATPTVFSSGSGKSKAGSRLREDLLRKPYEGAKGKQMDLFEYAKARLSEIPFRPPQLDGKRTPDTLRREMLRTVFGWDADIVDLIRDEGKLGLLYWLDISRLTILSFTASRRFREWCSVGQMAR
jgi:hypothetical protein